jgi:transcriptional regulator with XRE-family HTH domain
MNVFEMGEPLRLAADDYRRKHGLLTSEVIRARREALGMSQAVFAEWVGIGVASVKRYELGGVQDAGIDKRIRVHTGITEAKDLLAALKRQLGPAARRPPKRAPAASRRGRGRAGR